MAKSQEIFMGRVVKRHSPATISGTSAASYDTSGMGSSGTVSSPSGSGGGMGGGLMDFGAGSKENQKKLEEQASAAHAQARAELDI